MDLILITHLDFFGFFGFVVVGSEKRLNFPCDFEHLNVTCSLAQIFHLHLTFLLFPFKLLARRRKVREREKHAHADPHTHTKHTHK